MPAVTMTESHTGTTASNQPGPSPKTRPRNPSLASAAGSRDVRRGNPAGGNRLERQDQNADLAQLGVGGQRGLQLSGQHYRIRFIGRAIGLDLTGSRVDEESHVLPSGRDSHTAPQIGRSSAPLQ
jgi:hypothetical protein